MSVPEIEAAQAKLASVGERLTEDSKRLLNTLLDAQACGAEVRQLDIQTIRVRYMTQIPQSLKSKIDALKPKGSAE